MVCCCQMVGTDVCKTCMNNQFKESNISTTPIEYNSDKDFNKNIFKGEFNA